MLDLAESSWHGPVGDRALAAMLGRWGAIGTVLFVGPWHDGARFLPPPRLELAIAQYDPPAPGDAQPPAEPPWIFPAPEDCGLIVRLEAFRRDDGASLLRVWLSPLPAFEGYERPLFDLLTREPARDGRWRRLCLEWLAAPDAPEAGGDDGDDTTPAGGGEGDGAP